MMKIGIIFFSLLFIGGACFADELNLGTGEYIMDMGGGDEMNLDTGEYQINMGGGDKMNLDTGEYIMNLD